jgi:putative ABC transport system permease protein
LLPIYFRDVIADIRYSLRRLRRTPGFTGTAVVTLALGIAASTTVFSVANAVVFKPQRALQSNDVHSLWLFNPSQRGGGQLTDVHREALSHGKLPGIGAIAGAQYRWALVRSQLAAAELSIEVVTGDYNGVFDLRPAIGQGLDTSDAPALGPHVVISDRLWRQWYRADPSIVGKERLKISGVRFLVVGVAPPDFVGAFGAEVWVPRSVWQFTIDGSRTQAPARSPGSTTSMPTFAVLTTRGDPGRLSMAATRALASSSEPPREGFAVYFTSVAEEIRQARSGDRSLGLLIVALSSLVLFAACANLANMLYARGAQRSGEVAVRNALGGSTARVFRLFFAETALVSVTASVLGLGLTVAALHLVGASFPALRAGRFLTASPDFTPDWMTFAYAAAAGSLAALLVGGATAWRASRIAPMRAFGSSGITASSTPRGRWLRTGLVSVQVSTAVILMLGTSLYLVEAIKGFETNLEFDFDRLATARVDLGLHDYNPTRGRSFFDRVIAQAQQLPDIEVAALATGLPGAAAFGAQSLQNLVAEDEANPGQLSTWRLLTGFQAGVSPGFLDTLALRLVRGRNFTVHDRDGAPRVVMLSESAARSLWPTADPIGKRVRLGTDPDWYTVVGIFQDAQRNRTDTSWMCSACLALYPYEQRYNGRMVLVVRSDAAGTAAEQARMVFNAVDDDVAVFDAGPAATSAYSSVTPKRALSTLVGSLGLVSLLIAALGVYGVISYSVSRRLREFGIRLALGATPRQIVKSVVDDGVHLILVGLVPGVLIASWATRLLEWRVVRLMPNDIPTWAAVPIFIMVIGLVAAYIPARRASRVNPNAALREL